MFRGATRSFFTAVTPSVLRPCGATTRVRPISTDRGNAFRLAAVRRNEEAKVGAIFTEISKSWSVHGSYLEAAQCTMPGRSGISVIQNARLAASIPLLGLNVADEATAALDSIDVDNDETPRQEVLVAVRGAGGGKTRAVEELVAELNKRALLASAQPAADPDPGVLGVAITFNHKWTRIAPPREQPADQRLHMAIEVASRVLSVLYSQSPDDVEEAMLKLAPIFADASEASTIQPGDVVRAVLAHAARRVGDARGRPVTKLVLCIDEAKRGVAAVFGDDAVQQKEALESLNCVYLPATLLPIIVPVVPEAPKHADPPPAQLGSGGHGYRAIGEEHGIDTLEKTETAPAKVDGIGEHVVDCGVYVTSLVTVKRTSTGRTLNLRPLSEVEPDKVNEFWLGDSSVHQSWKKRDADTTAVRELLAVIAAPLPRVLMYITEELRKVPTIGDDGRKQAREMFEQVLTKVQDNYVPSSPPPSLLFDAVFQKLVNELDQDTRRAVENSIFTNRFPSTDGWPGWMMPEPSLVMILAAVSTQYKNSSAETPTSARVVRRAQAVFEGVTNAALGEPLEHLLYEAIALRIAVAADAGKKRIGLAALFNVVGHTPMDSPILEKLGLGGHGYEAICEEHGIDTLEDLALFSEAKLRSVGFKTAHAMRLLKALSDLPAPELSVPMHRTALQATLDVQSTELVLHYNPSSKAHVVEGTDRLPSSGRGHQSKNKVAKLQQAFFKHISKLDVRQKIHIVRSAGGDAFDIAIISSHGVTLIDAKSGRPVSSSKQRAPQKSDFTQATYVANVLVPAAQAYLDSAHCEDPHGTVKKFAAGDSDFVYLRAGAMRDASLPLHTPDIAYDGRDSGFTITPRSVVGVVDTADRPFTPRVYLVCEGPVKGILGMYYPYYQVMRAAWQRAH